MSMTFGRKRFSLVIFTHLVTSMISLSQPSNFLIDEAATATLQITGYPDWIEIDKNSVWISNGGLNLMQRINPQTNVLEAEVRVNNPCAAFAIGHGSVWVASCGDKSIVRISLENNEILAAIPLKIADEEGSISIDGKNVWALSDVGGTLVKIDPATNAVVASIAVKPNSFAVASGFGAVWITNTGATESDKVGSVQRIDPRTLKIVATISVGKQPRFLATGENGVWVFNQGDGSVSRIDPKTNSVAATIECQVAGTGGDISAGEGYVWVRAKKELLLVIDPQSNKVIGKFGPPAGSGAVRAGEGFVWVSAHDVNKIWKLNPDIIRKKN